MGILYIDVYIMYMYSIIVYRIKKAYIEYVVNLKMPFHRSIKQTLVILQ